MKRAKLNNDKITALYCRLSKDDGTNNESMSISTHFYLAWKMGKQFKAVTLGSPLTLIMKKNSRKRLQTKMERHGAACITSFLIAETYSTEHITITTNEEQVHFECMDESAYID